MALLSNVAQIARQRSMHVYGFTHLCKLHHVSYGQPEDFFALPSVLREHRDFRSAVFRFAAAEMSNDQPLSLNEVAVTLALALGGLQIAAQQQLEVPDEFIAMLRSSLPPDQTEVAAEPGASGPVSIPPAPLPHPALPPHLRSAAQQATPVPLPTLAAAPGPITTGGGIEPGGQRPESRPATVPPIQISTRHAPALPSAPSRWAAPQAASPLSRRPPILEQALRTELPEDELAEEPAPARPATVGSGPELVAQARLLSSERRALQQRMQEVEERLTDVIQELGVVLEPASTEAHPESRAQVEPGVGIQSSPASAAVPAQQLASLTPVPEPIPDLGRQSPITFEAHGPKPPTRASREPREAVGSVSPQPALVDGLPRKETSIPPAVPLPSRRSSLLRRWPIALAVIAVLLLAAFITVQHLSKPPFTSAPIHRTAGPPTANSQTTASQAANSQTAGSRAANSQTAAGNPLPRRPTKPSAGISVPATYAPAAQGEISDTLGRWASAAAHNDPIAQSAFYAPSVDRYFLRRNVSRGYVLADMRAFHARGNKIGTFTISDVTTQSLSPSTAVVNLRKTWSVATSNGEGPLHFTRSRLWLQRGAQGWQITGEQDLTSAR